MSYYDNSSRSYINSLPITCWNNDTDVDFETYKKRANSNDPECLLKMAYFYMFGYGSLNQSYILSTEYYQKFKKIIEKKEPSPYEEELADILQEAYGKFLTIMGTADTSDSGWEYDLYHKGERGKLQDKYEARSVDDKSCMHFINPEICVSCNRWKIWRM